MNRHYSSLDLGFLLEQNNKKPCIPPKSSISEYAEEKRILPSNTPFPGLWKNRRTPYAIEIMENLGPFSPIQETVVMKGAQLGLTAAAENIMAFYMDELPAEILYISATETLLEKWATKRLEPLIDSCGFRNKIYAQTMNTKSRRSGDKILSKEYVGGNLDMASAQSASSLRSDSKRILIFDEVDGSPVQLKTGEGNWIDVARARASAWGARKKIMIFSTPTTFEASQINVAYEHGDQRKYQVPCPHCEHYQELRFGNAKTEYGIKVETVAGGAFRAYYRCGKCKKAIYNYHKVKMLSRGRWVSMATSSSKTIRSYHISSLYSPVGMLSWSELWNKFLIAQKTPDGMRSFVNLYLGLPFKEMGSRPKLDKVIELRGGRRAGTVADGVLFLTAGIDVQQGSAKDPNNPPRLEMEVLGIGPGYRTYSVQYYRFVGDVSDPHAGAWLELTKFVDKGGLNFKRREGKDFSVKIIFIDSGDGTLTDVIYEFTAPWTGTFPTKGFSSLKLRKNEKGDEITKDNFRRYRAKKINEDTTLYEMSTNYYKTHIYRNLKISRREIDPQKPGFCDFPLDYGEKYFRMLTAEEKRRDGSFYCPSGRRNEALDCRVMALCAADVYLDALTMDYKATAKQAGATVVDLQKITHSAIIEILKQKILPPGTGL